MSFAIFHRGKRLVALLGAAGALALACSSAPATTAKTECKAGEAYYCRCPDRQEGTRVCNDDGATYGPCEPCIPEEPLPPEEDASFPDEDAATSSDASDAGSDGGTCPNGAVDPDEACDDGNRAANDGCSATCTLEGGSTVGDKCPGMAVHVWDKPVSYTGSTIGATSDYTASPSCSGETGGFSPDRVFAVTAHKAGTLRVATSAANFPHMLYRADTCTAAGATSVAFPHAACSNVAGNGNETLSFPVTNGSTTYVVLDGAGTGQQQGNFTVTFAFQ